MNLKYAALSLRTIRTGHGWRTNELADRARHYAGLAGDPIKFTQQSISGFEMGRSKRIPRWLHYATQALEAGDVGPSLPFSALHDENALVQVKLPTFANGGGGGTGDADHESIAFSRSLIERELRAQPSDMLAVVIEGDSMEPDFRSGDQLLVDKRRQSIAQPGAFCLWDGDGYVIKLLEKVYDREPSKIRVVSRNSAHSASERLVDEVSIMGRVVWFGRRV